MCYPFGLLFRYDEVLPAGPLVGLGSWPGAGQCPLWHRAQGRSVTEVRAQAGCDCGTKVDSFRVLEHTADIGFEAFGASRAELFANAALALINLVVDLDTIRPSRELTVKTEGSSPPGLLVNWLSEILYLHDAEGWLFRDFSVQELGEKRITALARGEKFDRARHQAKLLVKAVTYHQLALEETPQGWQARVYVDI